MSEEASPTSTSACGGNHSSSSSSSLTATGAASETIAAHTSCSLAIKSEDATKEKGETRKPSHADSEYTRIDDASQIEMLACEKGETDTSIRRVAVEGGSTLSTQQSMDKKVI